MKKFICLEKLAKLAEKNGFKVTRTMTQLELWHQNSEKPRGLWHNGSLYSTADIVISSNPGIGYGYNEAFHGPYHYGFAHVESYGVKKLLDFINVK